MKELERGKLYIIYSSLRYEEDAVIAPFSTFVFATKDPYHDVEDAGVTIVNGTLVVYLEQFVTSIMHFKLQPIIEQAVYFKLLVEDQILYVLDDGYASFERVNTNIS